MATARVAKQIPQSRGSRDTVCGVSGGYGRGHRMRGSSYTTDGDRARMRADRRCQGACVAAASARARWRQRREADTRELEQIMGRHDRQYGEAMDMARGQFNSIRGGISQAYEIVANATARLTGSLTGLEQHSISQMDMLKQLVLLESQRLVPKSMCEDYRNRVANAKPLKTHASRTNVTPQKQLTQ